MADEVVKTRGRRGKKPQGIDQQIAALEAKIATAEDKVQNLKDQLAQLQAQKTQLDAEAISQALAKSGKSVEDVLGFINAKDA